METVCKKAIRILWW